MRWSHPRINTRTTTVDKHARRCSTVHLNRASTALTYPWQHPPQLQDISRAARGTTLDIAMTFVRRVDYWRCCCRRGPIIKWIMSKVGPITRSVRTSLLHQTLSLSLGQFNRCHRKVRRSILGVAYWFTTHRASDDDNDAPTPPAPAMIQQYHQTNSFRQFLTEDTSRPYVVNTCCRKTVRTFCELRRLNCKIGNLYTLYTV